MPKADIAFARFVAGIMMHVAMITEMKEGMSKMKYALNHFWRFTNYKTAFMAGLLQTITIVLISILNYYVIIAKSFDAIDIAKDFIALMVISEFDNIFYEEYSEYNIAKQFIMEKDDTFVEMFRI